MDPIIQIITSLNCKSGVKCQANTNGADAAGQCDHSAADLLRLHSPRLAVTGATHTHKHTHAGTHTNIHTQRGHLANWFLG